MKAVKVSHQMGHARQTLFATSFGVSVLIHGLMIGWMLSGSGSARSLLSGVPSFHTVSLVDAPGSILPLEPESQPQAIAEPAAIPEAMSDATVQNVEPETVVPPPQAKQATEIPEASVEPPAPAAKPKPVEEPKKPSAVETRDKKPAPAKASVKKPAPTQTSARKPAPAAPKVAAAQPKAAPAPKTTAKPRSPASRNSPQAVARAQQAIANMRRAQARVQGTTANQAPGSIAARMSDIRKQAYVERVRARIINAWHLPMPSKMAQGLQARVLLTIDREGQVIRYQLIGPSGSQTFDTSLQRAVQASLPLPPLPEDIGEDSPVQEFEFRFTPRASS